MSGTAPESKQLQEAHLLLYPYGKLSFIAIDKMQEKLLNIKNYKKHIKS